MLKKVSDNSYQCYCYFYLYRKLLFFDDYLLNILEKPVETIQKLYVNFNASFVESQVKYVVHIFYYGQKLLLMQLII